ncbi:MAG: membrane dipeptidase [Candidatus Aminicenantes bacterium]|nr:membrane dipeptidase [Candidatus Aminicenantes bacterium]
MKAKVIIPFVIILLSFTFCQSSCTAKQDEEALKARAREIHDKVLTVDTHCDTPMRMARGEWDIGQRHEPGQRRSGKIDLPRMAEGGLDAEFFAAFVGQGALIPEGRAKAKQRADLLIDAIHKMCEDYPDLVGLATTPEDAYRLEREGKRAAFIGMENGYPIGKDISLVEKFYERGVRYITLCHGSDNDICDSSTDRRNPEDNGLSDFGKEVVAECNRLGIMIDVSHISDKSFFDVVELTKAPVIASHSSVRTLCNHPRNLSDEMLRALTANGGVIQICFVSSFVKESKPNPEREKAIAELREKYGSLREVKDEALQEKIRKEYTEIFEKYPAERATLKDLVDHIDFVVDLIGVDHVGIGTDFDGGGGIEGCDDVSEMSNITEELLRRSYSEEDIQKIWGGNLMRVFKKVCEIAK